MSEENVEETVEEKEFNVVIKITNQNLSYKSDFSEPETIFWLEAVKDIILKKTFEDTGLKSWKYHILNRTIEKYQKLWSTNYGYQ